MSSQLQQSYKQQHFGTSSTINSSHPNQQQILQAAQHVTGHHPGSSGSYSKPGGGLASSNSVNAAYGHINSGAHVNKLSPTGGGSRLSTGASPIFPAK